jgi:predicted DsbA family dithiol-disulfide isomerase
VEVKFTHFPLHPETPDDGLTLEQLFAGRGIDIEAAKSRMERLMAAEELPYGNRTMTYNSRLAQELAVWAQTQPNGESIHSALFIAYFVDGLNLAVTDNLVAVVQQMGLDCERAREVLATRSMRDAVDADWQRSRELGVTGVPTFAVGQQRVVGAQPYESLEQLIIDAGAQRR